MATHASNALLIRPDGPGVQNSSVRVQATVGGTGTADTLVRIDPTLANIENNLLYFHEVNTGSNGIRLMSPSSSTEFTNNLVRTLHTHAISNVGVQLGDSATNASRLHHNSIEMRTNTDLVAGYTALQVWADFNTINIYALNSGLSYGARFEVGSNDNVTAIGQLQAAIPLLNLGMNNVFQAAGAAQIDVSESGQNAVAIAASAGNTNARLLGQATARATAHTTASRHKTTPLLLAAQPLSRQGGGKRATISAIDAAFEHSSNRQNGSLTHGLSIGGRPAAAGWDWLDDLATAL